jgi:hypothetical protein
MNIKVIVIGLSLLLTACGEYALKGAGKGAVSGAASGAVGGLVSALIFGGDPAEAAARGAAYGSAAGATAGAISGGQADANIRDKKKAEAEKIRARIGDNAFKGLTALASCDYGDALDFAYKSKQSENPNFAVSGYWLEVLTYADQSSGDKVDSLLPELVNKDWETATEKEARAHSRLLQDELVNLRKQYKLEASCS